MNKDLVKEIVEYFEENNTPYCLHLLNESVGKIDTTWVKEFSIKYNMKIENLKEEVVNNISDYEVFQLNAHIKDEDIEKLKNRFDDFSFVKLIDVEEGYDIFNRSCSKGSAIRYIKIINNNESIKYYAFGDGFNDLEMFEEVDYSIAMGNGCNELKKRADFVTDHINDNGLYNALKRLRII